MSVNKKIIEAESTQPIGVGFAAYTNQSNSAAGGEMQNIGFQPDLSWHRTRDRAEYHHNYNSSFDSPTSLYRVDINRNDTRHASASGFEYRSNNNGVFYQPSGNTGFNNASEKNLHYFWKINGGTTSTNNDGNSTCTVQANQTHGISVVEWSGNNTGGRTLGHGLGADCKFILLKNTDDAEFWCVWHTGMTSTSYFSYLRAENEKNNSKIFGGTINSSVFTISGTGYDGTNTLVNTSGKDYYAYCFADVAGYQKFGTYTGNGTSSNQITGLGFEPKFLMIHRNSGGAEDWIFFDAARNTSNPRTIGQSINEGNVTGDTTYTGGINFDSDGFTINYSSGSANASGSTYLYWAIGGDGASAINCIPNYSN